MHTSRLSPIARTVDAVSFSKCDMSCFRRIEGAELAGRACRVRVAKIEVKTKAKISSRLSALGPFQDQTHPPIDPRRPSHRPFWLNAKQTRVLFHQHQPRCRQGAASPWMMRVCQIRLPLALHNDRPRQFICCT